MAILQSEKKRVIGFDTALTRGLEDETQTDTSVTR